MIMNKNRTDLPARDFSSFPSTAPIHRLGGIFIRHNDYYRKTLYNNLLWLHAGGSYCDLHFRDGKHLTVSLCLASVLSQLPSDRFCRIHQSYAVNLHAITMFYGNTVCLGEREFPVSRTCRPDLLSRLNILGNR